MYTQQSLAAYIDHTLLRPEATPEQIEALCAEAVKYSFASVCVNPFYVPLCTLLTKNTDVKVCTVIGFPLGANRTGTKLSEAAFAVSDGAKELDTVINIGALKAGDHLYVENELKEIRRVAGSDVTLKVIIETALLTREEKISACKICGEAGADFIKTSTGFIAGGAVADDVALLFEYGAGLKVKASGGIKTLADALSVLKAGAARIGASASVTIINELDSEPPV